jgi:hypothetical protein
MRGTSRKEGDGTLKISTVESGEASAHGLLFGRQKVIRFLQQKWGHKANASFAEYKSHMVARSGGHAGEDSTRSIFRPIAVPILPLLERVASLAMPSLWLYGSRD